MTKAEQCIAIFGELVAAHGEDFKVIRKLFIQRAVDEAGCTLAGAATYYANCKNRGGATGDTRIPAASRDPNYVPTPRGVETNDDDRRPLYSAVQPDKHGNVAAVDSFFNPVDAMAKAKRVRGIACFGSPEIGVHKTTLRTYLEQHIDADGLVHSHDTFELVN